jgi:large subunit ribosomal protein L21
MFAIIKSGGRQYKVSVGQRLEVNRLPVDAGQQVKFEEVLLISDANNTMIGKPLVANAMVLATATKQGRGKKVIVFKYKSKKRYRHRRGHRQELTFLTIDDIIADGKSLITGEAPTSREEELPAVEELEALPETTELEAATGEVPEIAEPEPEVEEKKAPRRRRTKQAEETESPVLSEANGETEAPTGEATETSETEPEVEEKKFDDPAPARANQRAPRRRRTKQAEDTESETEE